MKKRIILAAGLVIILCTFSQAELIYIAIEATVDTVTDPCGHLGGNISAGGLITGYYCYESTTNDSNPSDDVGEWWNDAPCGVFLKVGGFNFESDPVSTEFYLAVGNDLTDGDSYIFRSKYHISLPNSIPVNDIILQLNDETGAALSSDELPITSPVLENWDDKMLHINGGPRESVFDIHSHITSALLVPEPLTLVFLIFGAVGLRKRLN